MLSFRVVFYVIGIVQCILGTFMAAPALLDWYLEDYNWQYFGLSILITLFSGGLLVLMNRPTGKLQITVREAFLMTTFTWVISSLFAALPFILSSATLTLEDGLFEAISSITTTGATALPSVDHAPRGILLWRSILQWLGGIGIIIMAMTVLPILKIGGMQLFRTEFSDRSDKILPRASQVATAISITYFSATVLCVILLWCASMPLFDAVCYAMVTISTGGLSLSSSSIASYNSPIIEGILMVFMFIGATTLILYYRALTGDWRALVKDKQVALFAKITLGAVALVTLWELSKSDLEFWTALRYASFSSVATITSTGLSIRSMDEWGSFPVVLFLLLMFVGGCTGSTAGGIKVFRFQVMIAVAKAQLHQLRHPHGIFLPQYNGVPIQENVFTSVFTFFALYGISFGVIALALSCFNLDLLTCLTFSASVIGNAGLGIRNLGNEIFTTLPIGAKYILMFGMLLGRLELVTVFILFSRNFWRN